MQCQKCTSQDLGEVKSGISKKGNPYKGRKCVTCGNFNFIPLSSDQKADMLVKSGMPGGASPPGEHVGQPTNAQILEAIKRTNELLVKYLGPKDATVIEKEELEPDSEVPF